MAEHAAHSHAAHEHHVQPMKYYILTALALTVFMGLTMFFAFFDFHNVVINNLIAVGIATIKATIVVWFFMHVKFASVLGKLFAALGFVWLLVLCTVLVDYGFRSHEPSITWQPEGHETALPRKLGSTDGMPNLPNHGNNEQRPARGSLW